MFCVPRSLLPKKDLSEDIVLITGGGRGLGRHLALEFARNGCKKIVLWDVDQKNLVETCALVLKEGSNCFTYVVDVTDYDKVISCSQDVLREVGTVSILVNNAGIASSATILNMEVSKIRRTFDVNVLASFWVSGVLVLAYQFSRLIVIASFSRQSKPSCPTCWQPRKATS